MNKKCITLALGLSLLAGGLVHADWECGTLHQFSATGGNTTVDITLSSLQRLVMTTDEEQKTLCVEFQYGDEEKAKKVKTSSYRIDIPYDKETGLFLQFRPFVNTGNGKRFYLLDTGTPQGTKLIAYAKGEYHTAFDAATLAGDYKKSEIEITKKEIKITLEDAEGNTTSYPLTYDNKTKMFTAEGVEIKADTEAEGNTEVEVNIESKGNTETTESTETAKSEA